MIKVNIEYCGICGSDLPKFLMKRPRPDILGHEFCGYDVESGEFGVIIPKLTDGKFIGSNVNGGFQKFIEIPDENWFPTPKLARNRQVAAMLEPMSNCVHCLSLLNIDKKTKVAIIGDGFIGNMLATLIPENNVKVFGRDSLPQENYYDIAIDCCGKPESMNTCFKCLKPRGTVMMVGIPYAHSFNGNFDYDKAMRKELVILNSWQSNYSTDWTMSYDILAANPNKYLKLIDKVFELEDLNKAFNYKLSNHCNKIMVKCN